MTGWHSHVRLASLRSADQQPAQLGAAGGRDGAGHARRPGHAHWRRLRRHRQQHAAVRFPTCYCGVVCDHVLNKTERPGHALNFSNYFFTKLILFTSLLKNEGFKSRSAPTCRPRQEHATMRSVNMSSGCPETLKRSRMLVDLAWTWTSAPTLPPSYTALRQCAACPASALQRCCRLRTL